MHSKDTARSIFGSNVTNEQFHTLSGCTPKILLEVSLVVMLRMNSYVWSFSPKLQILKYNSDVIVTQFQALSSCVLLDDAKTVILGCWDNYM